MCAQGSPEAAALQLPVLLLPPTSLPPPLVRALHAPETCLMFCRAAFEAVPQLAALVPPEASPLSRPVLRAAVQGLTGQQARATVYVQEVLLGSGTATGPGSSAERPRAATYHATFRSV